MRGSCEWDDAVPGTGPVRANPAGLIRPVAIRVFTCALDPVKPRVEPEVKPEGSRKATPGERPKTHTGCRGGERERAGEAARLKGVGPRPGARTP
jgi:hypothetical protein